MQSEVRVDSDEMSVEGRVVDFRERDTIADHRLAKQLMSIFDNMSGVEQHGFGETGQSTPASVGANNGFSEGLWCKRCRVLQAARIDSRSGSGRLLRPNETDDAAGLAAARRTPPYAGGNDAAWTAMKEIADPDQ
jgi:hypothetical protein